MFVPIDIIGELSIADWPDVVSYGPSGFFPAPQRTEVKHLPIEPAGGHGLLMQPLDLGIPSMNEMLGWESIGYQGVPYADLKPPAEKTVESKGLFDMVSGIGEFAGDIFKATEQGLDWAIGTKHKITSLFDLFEDEFSGRDPIPKSTQQPGYYSSTEQHFNDLKSMAADVYKTTQAWGTNMLDQVKGLFSVGYPQYEKQPIFSVGHEIQATPTVTIGFLIVAAIIVFILVKKR